jgi:hypothetical protein
VGLAGVLLDSSIVVAVDRNGDSSRMLKQGAALTHRSHHAGAG